MTHHRNKPGRLLIVWIMLVVGMSMAYGGSTAQELAIPEAPDNLQVSYNQGETTAAVFWINSESDYDSIIVERRNAAGTDNWYPVQVVGGATVLVTDDGLVCGGGYIYRVKAVREGFESGYSNEAASGFRLCNATSNLVIDGGFELGTLSPDVWAVKNGTGEKVKCDKLKKNLTFKEFSFTGRCALQVKGSANENSRVQQKLTVPEEPFYNQPVVFIDARVRAQNLTEGTSIKIVAKYPADADTTERKAKLVIPIPAGTYDYSVVENSIIETFLQLETMPQNIKVQVKNRASGGKAYIDNVAVSLGAIAQ